MAMLLYDVEYVGLYKYVTMYSIISINYWPF